MGKILKSMCILVLLGLMSSVSLAADYKFFSIQLSEGWSEIVPQKATKRGDYVVVFSNANRDTAVTITASPKAAAMSPDQIVKEAEKIMNRLKRQGIEFVGGNFDQNQGVLAVAGVSQKDQQQWRIVMVQENNVLYTVLFNGRDIDNAAKILNTLKATTN